MIFNLIVPMRSWSWFCCFGPVVLEDVVCVVGGYGDSSLGSLLVFMVEG